MAVNADGTLCATLNVCSQVLMYAIDKFGSKLPDVPPVRCVAGPNARVLFFVKRSPIETLLIGDFASDDAAWITEISTSGVFIREIAVACAQGMHAYNMAYSRHAGVIAVTYINFDERLSGIYVVEYDSGNVIRTIVTPRHASAVTYSTDGNYLIFVQQEAQEPNCTIRRLPCSSDVGGDAVAFFTGPDTRETLCNALICDEDGGVVAGFRRVDDGETDVMYVDAVGGTVRTVVVSGAVTALAWLGTGSDLLCCRVFDGDTSIILGDPWAKSVRCSWTSATAHI